MNQLHPIMAQAMRPWIPPTQPRQPRMVLRRHIRADADEKSICEHCSGSGEGRYEGSTCYFCKGTGEL